MLPFLVSVKFLQSRWPSPDGHSHREVWEDELTWEEVRSIKPQSAGGVTSQEPSSTPELFESILLLFLLSRVSRMPLGLRMCLLLGRCPSFRAFHCPGVLSPV